MENKYYDIEAVGTAKDFLILGLTDYLAARVLINNGLLIQGVCLASTCIEKYFKAIVALSNEIPHKHLNTKLIQQIYDFDPNLSKNFNPTFLELLTKSYKLRYISDLSAGYSIVLIQFPILAEIDLIVQKIESQFSFFEYGEKIDLGYQRLIREKDPRILENNFLYMNINKDVFIEMLESKVYCIRILSVQKQKRKIEITYTAEKQPHDGNFLKELIIIHNPSIKDNKSGFELPYTEKGKI